MEPVIRRSMTVRLGSEMQFEFVDEGNDAP
jgi:hypothetical protein